MPNSRFKNGGSASDLTDYRKNRMIYTNVSSQQQRLVDGCSTKLAIENNGSADASIIPTLRKGAVFITQEEKEEILSTLNCQTSSQSNATVPSDPIITGVTQANQSLILDFTLASDGGATISDYQYSLDNGVTYNSSGYSSSPLIISSLTNGTLYSVVIRAVNSVGTSAASNAVTGTPTATIVTFTTVGTTTWTVPTNIFRLEYLVVGGGGGGGGGYDTGAGGGGGGGLVLNGNYTTAPASTYTVIVGDGGAGGVGTTGVGDGLAVAGGSSQFATITASGGDFGKGSLVDRSGIGGARGDVATLTAPAGGKGGRSTGGIKNLYGSGGGGGMGSAGTTATTTTNAAGGSGVTYTISGSSVTYGAGGNGRRVNVSSSGVAGTANTGNGGSGAGSVSSGGGTGGKGGSGIVIIKY